MVQRGQTARMRGAAQKKTHDAILERHIDSRWKGDERERERVGGSSGRHDVSG
jgi:hypothetical protein